jgi:hypothetical protein
MMMMMMMMMMGQSRRRRRYCCEKIMEVSLSRWYMNPILRLCDVLVLWKTLSTMMMMMMMMMMMKIL